MHSRSFQRPGVQRHGIPTGALGVILLLLGMSPLTSAGSATSSRPSSADAAPVPHRLNSIRSSQQGESAPKSTRSEEEYRHAPVGEPRWIRELVIPGSELISAPGDFRSPIVIRIDSVSPHGSDLRYDLTWYGLDPGVFDLRDYLRRVDGSSLEDAPTLLVEVLSVLPAGLAKPKALDVADLPLRPRYRLLLWVSGIIWIIGLILLLRMGRKQRQDQATATRPRTLAEVLRPLVLRGMDGQLSEKERGELELTLIAHWRRKLGWESMGSAEALARLRAHPEAGDLLIQLENWLHRPTPPTDVNLEALLAPYADVRSDDPSPSAIEPQTKGAI